MKIIIDRLEDKFAIVELPSGQMLSVPQELFFSAKEGDVYEISKDEGETISREEQMRQRFDSLRED